MLVMAFRLHSLVLHLCKGERSLAMRIQPPDLIGTHLSTDLDQHSCVCLFHLSTGLRHTVYCGHKCCLVQDSSARKNFKLILLLLKSLKALE